MHLRAARFNQTNPAFGPVFGGGATIWMGGTAPSFFQDHLYIVTGPQPSPMTVTHVLESQPITL
jgi:hypothetical protein